MPRPAPPVVIVTMGVAGTGKSTAGRAIAEWLAVPFQEGDAFHARSNMDKMARGVPLDDLDRAPWLDAVAGWIADHAAHGGVVSCSALKRAHRERLRGAAPGRMRFVLLEADEAAVRTRMARRRDHFMPASLLADQLAAFEPPSGEPDILPVDGAALLQNIVAAVACWLSRSPANTT